MFLLLMKPLRASHLFDAVKLLSEGFIPPESKNFLSALSLNSVLNRLRADDRGFSGSTDLGCLMDAQ